MFPGSVGKFESNKRISPHVHSYSMQGIQDIVLVGSTMINSDHDVELLGGIAHKDTLPETNSSHLKIDVGR